MMKKFDKLPQKEILERLKIETEINELKKPFYKQKEFFIAILPIGLGIIGLIFSWASGYFDIKLREIQVSKDELAFKISKLEFEEDSLYKNFRRDSIRLSENYENKNIELNNEYQRRKDSLENEYQAEIETRIKERERIENNLKLRIDNLDLSNSKNKETIKDLVKQNESDKEIIAALKKDNIVLKNKLKTAESDLDNVYLLKQKYKLITFFRYNRRYEWLGFKQAKNLVGEDFTPEIVKKLIEQYPDVFFEYFTNLKEDPKGIALKLDVNWEKLK